MHKLTPRQQIILEAIKLFVAKHHYSPTVREIGDIVGSTSSITVAGYLERLKKKGLVTWEEGRPRSLKIIVKEPA
ncbi:transcriptional regulator [Fictibacillus sp. KIGAM418]|uniref:Transcriptional regulator n=1 Tax=Fictibacillus marinisediminis TaxID=2878389 RepID=A0A9X1XG29_9BACL|nr:transcriptional regulator [Fictibacillus marinisediminis]MCK6259501.1 transcriptional regulator [Fictibacillus marinisediminis]